MVVCHENIFLIKMTNGLNLAFVWKLSAVGSGIDISDEETGACSETRNQLVTHHSYPFLTQSRLG